MDIKRTTIAFIVCTQEGCEYVSVDLRLKAVGNVSREICPACRERIVEAMRKRFGASDVIYSRRDI